MTTFRLIPFPYHGALDMITGLATMVLPFALGMSPAAAVTGVVIGALLVGLALAGVVDDAGRTSLPVSAHHAADYGIAIGLFGAAALFGLANEMTALLGFGAIALAQLAVNLNTRYSLRA
jgi:hypothetical protein